MSQTFQDRKHIALKVLEQISKIAAARGAQESVDAMEKAMDHLRSGELHVVVCGECKRGKSSLLNAFLDEADLCPVDALVATNAITMIRYGEAERIVVHFRNEDGEQKAEEVSREQLRSYVTEQGNDRNRKRVELVQIWLPNPKLKDGLVLYDTPGVGGLNIEHTAAAYAIIPFADAVLFAGEAGENLGPPELGFVERILRHSPHFLHVLTKRDSVSNWRQKLQENLDKLRSIVKGDVQGVAVSSKLKLEYLRTGDQEDLELSGFPEFERAIWDILAKRGDILLARAVVRALSAMSELRLPVETEHQALSATSEEERKRIEDRLKDKAKRAEELASESSFWVNELSHRMAALRNDSAKWIADEFAGIQRSLNNYLRVESYLKDPIKLADMLTVDTNNGFAVVVRRLESSLGNIVDDLRETTALAGLKGGAANVSAEVSLQLDQVEGRNASFLAKASDVGRSCTIHSMGLGMAGTLVGGVVGGIIGSIVPGAGTVVGAQIGMYLAGGIAGAVGGIFGIKKGIADQAERDVVALRQNLGAVCREQLAAAQRTVMYELNSLLANAQSEIHASLLREIQGEQKACKESIAVLQETGRKQHADRTGRLRELSNTLKLIDNLKSTLDALAEPPATGSAQSAG